MIVVSELRMCSLPMVAASETYDVGDTRLRGRGVRAAQ